MDKRQGVTKINNGIKILLWLVFGVFFVYSFHTIVDLKGIVNSRRQESIIRVITALSKPNIFDPEIRRDVAVKMLETIQIAFLATTISAVFALPFTRIIARPSSAWSRGLNFLLQPILSAVRAVHPVITVIPALVFTGIGPTTGVLVLTLFSTAVFIVAFSEYAHRHTSLSWLTLFKVYFPGLALKYLSVNMLIATVVGFTGGGGIGFILVQNLSNLYYSDASVAILACIIVIGSIDLLSRIIWQKIESTVVSPPAKS